MDPVGALENCLEQKAKLQVRLREYQERAKAEPDVQRRLALKAKASAYRAALRDLQVQIDHLDPPAVRRARREQRKRLDIGALAWDWFERGGECWSDLEGRSWRQVEAGDFVELGTDMDQLQEWLAEGSRRLTERQRLYIDTYYNQGLSLEMIGQTMGVSKSTAGRVIRNGLHKMQEWVEAKQLITACADGPDRFDWERYLREGRVLTPRQRQLVLLVLSGLPHSQKELAGKLELEQSTVSRTLARAGHTLRRLETPRGVPGTRPHIRDWAHATPLSLAEQTGMGLGDYYRLCGGRVHGLTRYRWELYRRMKAERSAEETARELALRPETVRHNWTWLRTQERRGLLHAGP